MEKSGKTDMVNLFLLGLQTSKSITIDLYKCETYPKSKKSFFVIEFNIVASFTTRTIESIK